jgi:hypothetical protein
VGELVDEGQRVVERDQDQELAGQGVAAEREVAPLHDREERHQADRAEDQAQHQHRGGEEPPHPVPVQEHNQPLRPGPLDRERLQETSQLGTHERGAHGLPQRCVDVRGGRVQEPSLLELADELHHRVELEVPGVPEALHDELLHGPGPVHPPHQLHLVGLETEVHQVARVGDHRVRVPEAGVELLELHVPGQLGAETGRVDPGGESIPDPAELPVTLLSRGPGADHAVDPGQGHARSSRIRRATVP